MNMRIQTVYIFEIVDEKRMLEVAREKAKQHPLQFSNVCYHRANESCNDRCYTMSLQGDD